MNILMNIIVALLSAAITYINLDQQIADKVVILKRINDTCENKKISAGIIRMTTLAAFIAAFAASYFIFQHVEYSVDIFKMNIALICLMGAAAMDYREHRIPNIYPAVIAVSGIGCLMTIYFTEKEKFSTYMFSSVTAAVGIAVCFTIAMILSHHGIGLGDIKLLCALGLLGGVYTVCGTVFFAMITCAIVAVILLISKKSDMHGSLPFAPFILGGYLITIFTSIY